MMDPTVTADALIEGLPDLVLLVRRDGVVLQWGGGHGVPNLRPSRERAGQRLEGIWSRPVAGLPAGAAPIRSCAGSAHHADHPPCRSSAPRRRARRARASA